MNIIFLSLGRLNNIEERGVYTDLLRKFRDSGHKVYIVSASEKRLKKPTELLEENGAHILKVRIGNITKTNIIEKGISTLRIESLYLKAVKNYFNKVKFDLIIYSTPPITFGKVISYIKKRDNARSYLLLKDIFPQNAVDLDMFRKTSLIHRYFRLKEKQLYSISDYIGCMSRANVKYILENNPELSHEKVEICPNSIEPEKIEKKISDLNKVKIKYKIPLDKTIFLYGGNIGKPQGVDFIIQCLETNRYNEDVYFVIAGSGTEFNKLERYFKSTLPPNAQLLSELPKTDYEGLAISCDVGLVFLDNRFTIPNFPSRLLSYMQASIPVLAATDKNTDIGEVIESGDFGFWCVSGNIDSFNEKIKLLGNKQLRERMGKNARKYLENNYTSKHSYEIIMSHFK